MRVTEEMAIDTVQTPHRDPPVVDASPANIWEYQQNRVALVVEDIVDSYMYRGDMSDEALYRILMARGVNKALATRRKLIWLKQRVKAEITRRAERASSLGPRERAKNAGALEALNCVLRSLRAITHGPRWTNVE